MASAHFRSVGRTSDIRHYPCRFAGLESRDGQPPLPDEHLFRSTSASAAPGNPWVGGWPRLLPVSHPTRTPVAITGDLTYLRGAAVQLDEPVRMTASGVPHASPPSRGSVAERDLTGADWQSDRGCRRVYRPVRPAAAVRRASTLGFPGSQKRCDLRQVVRTERPAMLPAPVFAIRG